MLKQVVAKIADKHVRRNANDCQRITVIFEDWKVVAAAASRVESPITCSLIMQANAQLLRHKYNIGMCMTDLPVTHTMLPAAAAAASVEGEETRRRRGRE